MPNWTVRVKFNHLPRLARLAPEKADEALAKVADRGVEIAKTSMEESPPTGRTYVRGARLHIASSPGNPPRVETGELLRSVRKQRRGRGRYSVLADGGHAAYLEFGNTRGLAPRPFMGPMARQLEGELEDDFDGFLDDEV